MTLFSRLLGADLTPAVRARVIIGLVASVVVAATSWASAAVLTPYLGSLTPGLELWARTGGSPLAASLTLLGLAILVWAWWDLRDRGLSTGTWMRVAALWALPLLLAAPLQSRDMYSYAAQGQLLNEGMSPYEHAVRDMDSDWVSHTSAVWLASPSPYGPFFLLLARGIAYASGGHIIVALALFRALAVASIVVTAWAITTIAGRLGLSEARTSTIAWLSIANPFVLSQAVAGGHNDAISTALIAVAVIWAWDNRLHEASMLVAFAGMIKVTAIIALPFVALVWVIATRRPSFRAITSSLFVSLGYALIPIILLSLGLGLGFEWVVPVDGLEAGVSPSFVSAIGMFIGSLGGLIGLGNSLVVPTVAVAQKLGVLVMLGILVATFLIVAARVLVDSARGAVARDLIGTVMVGLAIGLASTAILAPTIRGWYILWFLPIAALVLERRRDITYVAAATSLFTMLVQPDGSSVGVAGPMLPYAIVGMVVMVVIARAWIVWARGLAPRRVEIDAALRISAEQDREAALVATR